MTVKIIKIVSIVDEKIHERVTLGRGKRENRKKLAVHLKGRAL